MAKIGSIKNFFFSTITAALLFVAFFVGAPSVVAEETPPATPPTPPPTTTSKQPNCAAKLDEATADCKNELSSGAVNACKTVCEKGQDGCVYNTGTNSCEYNPDLSFFTSQYNAAGYEGPLPQCAIDGTCRNINDLLMLLLKVGEYIFGIVGSLALVMFVAGGYMMIFSMGNSERVQKGRGILVAAVVGLVIVFSAYLIVNFFLDTLNVKPEFRGIK